MIEAHDWYAVLVYEDGGVESVRVALWAEADYWQNGERIRKPTGFIDNARSGLSPADSLEEFWGYAHESDLLEMEGEAKMWGLSRQKQETS